MREVGMIGLPFVHSESSLRVCMGTRFVQPAFSRCGNQILGLPANENTSWPFSPKEHFDPGA